MRMFFVSLALRLVDFLSKNIDPELVVMMVGKNSYIYLTSNQSPNLPQPEDLKPDLKVITNEEEE